MLPLFFGPFLPAVVFVEIDAVLRGRGAAFFGVLTAVGVEGTFPGMDFERLRVFRPTVPGCGMSAAGC